MQMCTILTLFLVVLQTSFLSKTALPSVLLIAGFGSSSQRQVVSFPSPKGVILTSLLVLFSLETQGIGLLLLDALVN